MSLDSFTTTGARLRWTTGNGNRRIVIMRMGSPVNQFPLDSVNYPANSVFGSGANLGNGNFVVYNGMGSGVIVSGLNANQPYYLTVIEYNGINSTANYNITNVLNSFPVFLPVELLSFTGLILNKDIELNWKTSSEKDANLFEVQRSFDALNWEPVSIVKAAGNSRSIQSYSYTDVDVLESKEEQFYYRLKMIDNDASFTYSNIISFNNEKQDLSALKLYPNPLHQNTLHIEGLIKNQNYNLYVYDLSGVEVLRILHKNYQENTLDIKDSLKSGVYFFKIEQANSQQTKLMIVE